MPASFRGEGAGAAKGMAVTAGVWPMGPATTRQSELVSEPVADTPPKT